MTAVWLCYYICSMLGVVSIGMGEIYRQETITVCIQLPCQLNLAILVVGKLVNGS